VRMMVIPSDMVAKVLVSRLGFVINRIVVAMDLAWAASSYALAVIYGASHPVGDSFFPGSWAPVLNIERLTWEFVYVYIHRGA
jgi:hypothetical protein